MECMCGTADSNQGHGDFKVPIAVQSNQENGADKNYAKAQRTVYNALAGGDNQMQRKA